MKLTTFAKRLENRGFEVHFKALPEYTLMSEHMSECMTPKEIENYSGEWFCAEVSISIEGVYSEPEYLGGCAYDCFDDFTGCDNDYFDDMLHACLDDMRMKFNKIKTFVESESYIKAMEII